MRAIAISRRAVAALAAVAHGACMPGPVKVAAVPAPPPESCPASPTAAGDAQSTLLGAKSLMVPVQGVRPDRIPDTFAASRGSRSHGALDILAPRGTPVLAADAGRILRLSSNAAGGITIYQTDCDARVIYYYAHLEKYRDGLREGMTLRQGDVLGYVGTTGNAPPNTPHLHFQVMLARADGRPWEGEPVNPLPYLVHEGRSP